VFIRITWRGMMEYLISCRTNWSLLVNSNLRHVSISLVLCWHLKWLAFKVVSFEEYKWIHCNMRSKFYRTKWQQEPFSKNRRIRDTIKVEWEREREERKPGQRLTYSSVFSMRSLSLLSFFLSLSLSLTLCFTCLFPGLNFQEKSDLVCVL